MGNFFGRFSSCCITVSRWFRLRPGAGGRFDPIGHQLPPDDVEGSLRQPDDTKGSLQERDNVEEGCRGSDDVGGGHHEPHNVEGTLRQLAEAEQPEVIANGPTPKRKAVLVGISYKEIPPNRDKRDWDELDATHKDVERFRALLLNTYGYSPDDITVLKDDPDLSDLSQPTRANMIRELQQLVAGAAPGDTFIFLYSGHSDQQNELIDQEEEDGKDEVIITCDWERIIDNELNDILVKGLPVGCTLVTIFDTCHSGTMLDLPHYHCNDLYVPWLSKGERHTGTYQNKTVRSNAIQIVSFPDRDSRRPTLIANVQMLSEAPLSDLPLQIDTPAMGIYSIMNRSETSLPAGADRRESRRPRRHSSSILPFLYPTRRCFSPASRIQCDGWCEYDHNPRATVLSLSACSDPQRAWEGPRGSLTVVLCCFLETNPYPSYRALMTRVNFELHSNCRELHKYTRALKKQAAQGQGSGFEGEQNNFQSPQLSSLAKLDMDDIFRLN